MRPTTVHTRKKQQWTGQNSNMILGPAMILPAVVALPCFSIFR